jgi:hypothetical protein
MAIEQKYEYEYSTFGPDEDEVIEQTSPFKLHIWSNRMWMGEEAPFKIHPSMQWEDVESSLLRHYNNKAEIWPVWKYEHGAIVLKFSGKRSWDSGQLGYLVLPHKEALLIHGRKRMSPKFKAGILPELELERFDALNLWESWINGRFYDVYEQGSDERMSCHITEAQLEKHYPNAEERSTK